MPTIGEILSRVLRENKFLTRKDTVNNTSFLYIKSFEEDTGGRPLDDTQNVSGLPDLKMVPESIPAPGFATFGWLWNIQQDTDYTISCTLTNTGDLGVTAANLEFFLLNFSGDNSIFNPRVESSTRLEIAQPMYAVQEHSETIVPPLKWNSGSHSGPMILAARVTSQSPVDLPSDWGSLNPREDRHCANYCRIMLDPGYSMNFSDAADEQDSESQFQYSMSPTTDRHGALKTELAQQNLSLKSSPISPNFHFEAKITDPATGGATPRTIAPRPLGGFGGLMRSIGRRWQTSTRWDLNFPRAAKVSITMKPLNIQLEKNQVIAYDLIKKNRKTKKEEGRVTILYAQE